MAAKAGKPIAEEASCGRRTAAGAAGTAAVLADKKNIKVGGSSGRPAHAGAAGC